MRNVQFPQQHAANHEPLLLYESPFQYCSCNTNMILLLPLAYPLYMYEYMTALAFVVSCSLSRCLSHSWINESCSQVSFAPLLLSFATLIATRRKPFAPSSSPSSSSLPLLLSH